MPRKRARKVASDAKDAEYFEIVAKALRECGSYTPKFGKGQKTGLTLDSFQQMYRADPFYNWIGLDSPRMYAAHKAAGGMTSIYRQLGIGCEFLFQRLLQDQLGLTREQARWAYQVPVPGKTPRILKLDGRIALGEIRDAHARDRVEQWLRAAFDRILLEPDVQSQIRGVVFEVRQGYKSKDSKRQNADLSNASNAYANLYAPVLLLLSTQIDGDVAARYAQARWLLLRGDASGPATESTFTFCREVLEYDLAAFFERNSAAFHRELESILTTLLGAE